LTALRWHPAEMAVALSMGTKAVKMENLGVRAIDHELGRFAVVFAVRPSHALRRIIAAVSN